VGFALTFVFQEYWNNWVKFYCFCLPFLINM